MGSNRLASSLSTQDSSPGSPASAVFDLPTQNRFDHNLRQESHLNLLRLDISPGKPESDTAEPSCVFVSGGTGGNAICSAFARACYVLPVSDDGGSSSEIIRVLGGPSIGDIRSRLVRLIPSAVKDSPLDALRKLLAYRLPGSCSDQEARDEWRTIVEGRSSLWSGIPPDRKEAIRGFLVYFESEVLRRAHKNFSFRNGSIGNYFLAAAQGFFRSLPSAIFLFSSVTNSQANIAPAIVTNHTVTIAAELMDGQRLVGQCEISHPIRRIAVNDLPQIVTPDAYEDAISPSLPIGSAQNVAFTADEKENYEPLDAPIERLFYINAYGQEIFPSPNPDYIAHISSNEVLVYSCGSLWTSIVPCLALRGVGPAIARSPTLRAKYWSFNHAYFAVNSRNDRETADYTAVDYINAIVKALSARYQSEPYGLGYATTSFPVSAFITHLVHLRGTVVPVDVEAIARMGVQCVEIDSSCLDRDGIPMYDADCAAEAAKRIL